MRLDPHTASPAGHRPIASWRTRRRTRQHTGDDLSSPRPLTGLRQAVEGRATGHDIIDQQHAFRQRSADVITSALRLQTSAPPPQTLILIGRMSRANPHHVTALSFTHPQTTRQLHQHLMPPHSSPSRIPRHQDDPCLGTCCQPLPAERGQLSRHQLTQQEPGTPLMLVLVTLEETRDQPLIAQWSVHVLIGRWRPQTPCTGHLTQCLGGHRLGTAQAGMTIAHDPLFTGLAPVAMAPPRVPAMLMPSLLL